ncbi:MAG: rhodanese-related sulfurtransferase [Rickettsiales bacterium]
MPKNNYIITTFYEFADLPHYVELRPQIIKFCSDHGIKGTILLASEGINSTLVGTREGIDAFYAYVTSMPEFAKMEFKESFCDYMPFKKLKIRLKNEIVKLAQNNLNMDQRGELLDSQAWDDLLADPKTLLIDTRNDYEVVFGTFKDAINPKIRNFTDLPKWVEKNLKPEDKERPIAMFCTGGIRCEKSTAYMVQAGYKHVYHLKGGILKYFEETKNSSGNWNGRCFVFDDRVAVDPELKPYA